MRISVAHPQFHFVDKGVRGCVFTLTRFWLTTELLIQLTFNFVLVESFSNGNPETIPGNEVCRLNTIMVNNDFREGFGDFEVGVSHPKVEQLGGCVPLMKRHRSSRSDDDRPTLGVLEL